MNIDIMEFLLTQDVDLVSNDTKRHMISDEAFSLGGQFVVFENGNPTDIYRGDDFEEAMKYLTGEK